MSQSDQRAAIDAIVKERDDALAEIEWLKQQPIAIIGVERIQQLEAENAKLRTELDALDAVLGRYRADADKRYAELYAKLNDQSVYLKEDPKLVLILEAALKLKAEE